MAKELDYMEYPNNAAAQAAYVTSDVGGYSPDRCTGGSASASESTGGTSAGNAFNDIPNNVWACDPATTPDFIQYDFGIGVARVLRKVRIYCTFNDPSFNYSGPENFLIQGSNNDSDWDTLETVVGVDWADTEQWKEYTFANTTAYRYFRVYITVWQEAGRPFGVVGELEALEYVYDLQSYSEGVIVEQGSYSLKAIAILTDSLNETLTKTGLSIDLTGINTLKLWVYASRTGTNISIAIHDSGGTTTTKTLTVIQANLWTEITFDVSGVSDANKDDIDSIIIKVTNADAENIFYIDNFYGVEANPYPVSALNKNRISGYHCFMDQYMRANREGLDPLKLPDGTLF